MAPGSAPAPPRRGACGRLARAASAACAAAAVWAARPAGLFVGRPFGRQVRQLPRVARGVFMPFHACDPIGFKHKETIQQARQASIVKEIVDIVLFNREMEAKQIGDDEMMARIFCDDIIMNKDCTTAYLYMAASGNTMEQRQAFVWLARHKGDFKNAVAKRYKRRNRLPRMFFLESKWQQWADEAARGERYPELNVAKPIDVVKERLQKAGIRTPDEQWAKWGIGNPNMPVPKRGFMQPGVPGYRK